MAILFSCSITAVITFFLIWSISPPYFFVGKAFSCRRPAPTSLQNSHTKNMKSPFGPQRHRPSMPQLYRKCSDMTARVITPPVEGTSDFAGVRKDLNKWEGGEKGFPVLLKGDDSIYHPPFLGNLLLFSVREGRSPPNSSDSSFFE